MAVGMALKTYLKQEFEKMLNEELKKKKEKQNGKYKITEVKIADIVFAFNNPKLIELLVKRGSYITDTKFDDMRRT